MTSVADAPLAALCREADPATVTGFVAALYEARGLSAHTRDERHVVVSGGDRETRVAIVHPADVVPVSDLAATADTLVVVDRDVDAATAEVNDIDVVDATALGQQLAYAVDRPVARELLRSHFGWSPEGVTDEAPETARRVRESGAGNDPVRGGGPVRTGAGGDVDLSGFGFAWPFALRSRVLVAGLVVLAVAGGMAVAPGDVVGGQSSPVIGTDGPDSAVSTGTLSPTPIPPPPVEPGTVTTDAADPPAASTPTTAPQAFVDEYTTLPPGIDRSGTISPRRLADAHRSLLANRSYRLTLTYREFVDDRPVGVYTETIRVANATRYRASVSSVGTLRERPFTIAETDVYADGNVRYERHNSSVERATLLPYDRFLDDHAMYLRWFLEARESNIRDHESLDGTTRFFIVTEHNPYPSIRNTTGSVVVTDDGLVERARWSYDIAGTPPGYGHVSVTFRMRVSDIRSTTVTRPDWVNESTRGSVSTPTVASPGDCRSC